MWAEAERLFRQRITSMRFLLGTFMDRQTGALKTHRYRVELGATSPAPTDHSLPFSEGIDYESRMSLYRQVEHTGLRGFESIALAWRDGTYRPEPMKLVLVEKQGSPGKFRELAVPTVLDRLVQVVLFEVLEPVIDPILSPWQHGYRSTSIQGRRVPVPGFPNVARGSTKIVALRLYRGMKSGFPFVLEIDAVNAFPSVSRGLLFNMLVADGCCRRFANDIINVLGSRIYDPETGAMKQATGVPQGNVLSPLLFNFVVRRVHENIGPAGQPDFLVVSYADNFFILARTEEALLQGASQVKAALLALGLESKDVQKCSTSTMQPGGLRVLGHLTEDKDTGWIIFRAQGDLALLEQRDSTLPYVESLQGGRDPIPSLPSRDGVGVDHVEGDGSTLVLSSRTSPLSPPPLLGVGLGGEREESMGDGASPSVGSAQGVLGLNVRSGDGRYHPPATIRSGLQEKPADPVEQETAGGRSLPAHLDEQGDASSPDDIGHGVVGGEAVADPSLVFPVGEDEVLDRDKLEGMATSRPLRLTVPAWPSGEAHSVTAQRLVSRWKSLSGRAGKMAKTAVIEVPLDPRYVTTPGLFGCPRALGDDGDDHWRIAKVVNAETVLRIHLLRRRDAEPGVRDVREKGNHVVVVAFPAKGGQFEGFACGFVRVGNQKRPFLLKRKAPTAPNPTTAMAEALARFLDGLPADVSITIWTADDLLRSAIRGSYLDGKEFKGVRPPAMLMALGRMRAALKSRTGRVRAKRAKMMGAVMVEILSTTLAIARTTDLERWLGRTVLRFQAARSASSPDPGTSR